jgi:uncharacterized protein YoxC
MTDPTSVSWADITVGVAAVLGLIYVARTLRRVVQDVLDFMANHLSGVTTSLTNLTVATTKMADRVDTMGIEVREASRVAHDDAVAHTQVIVQQAPPSSSG